MGFLRFKENFNFELNYCSLDVEFEMLSNVLGLKLKVRKLGLLNWVEMRENIRVQSGFFFY